MAHQYSELFDRFWQLYGRDEKMNPAKKGTKYDAFMAYQKAGQRWSKLEGCEYSEEAFFSALGSGYDSNRRNREAARRCKEWVQNLPMASTWLNRMTFMDVHEVSTGELKAKVIDRECVGCGSHLVTGLTYEGKPICKACDVLDWKEKNKAKHNDMFREYPRQPGESGYDWHHRVMKANPEWQTALNRLTGAQNNGN